MGKLCEKEQCTGCSACASVCPKGCIAMLPNEEGFLRPVVDTSVCIECGLCSAVCPVLHQIEIPEGETTAWAARLLDDKTRLDSTSGGVFTALARWIFDCGGTVFGAAYDDKFSVCHRGVTTMEELACLRTAKYAQSDVYGSYSQVKSLLEAGEYVLFSGTPCQTEGLRSYLRHPYETLVLVDVVCHGVPSPQVWNNYLRYRREQDAPLSQIQAINLRSKETGWPAYSVRLEYDNGMVYSKKNSEDPYLRGFVGDLYLRPSCYSCPFKGVHRGSDFTLADYWGVWSQHPEMNDGKGVSMVLVHSDKGKNIWQEICSRINVLELSPDMAVKENPSALYSSQRPKKREEFWLRYQGEDFCSLITELLPPPPPPSKPSLLRRGLGKVKRIIERR